MVTCSKCNERISGGDEEFVVLDEKDEFDIEHRLLNYALQDFLKVDVGEPDAFPLLSRSFLMHTRPSCNESLPYAMCTKCLDFISGQLRKEKMEVVSRRTQMKILLDELIAADPGRRQRRQHCSELSQRVQELLIKQSELIDTLISAEKEQSVLDKKLSSLSQRERQLSNHELLYWEEFCKTKKKLQDFSESRDSLKMQILKGHRVLKELKPVHAFNHAFFIWRQDSYGTINGFRLGKLNKPEMDNAPPEWSEVNTAWGLSAMLLTAIAHNSGYNFQHFKIKPMGAHSTVYIKSNPNVEYNLFYNDDGATISTLLSGLIRNPPWPLVSFNSAIAVFVICLKDLMEYAVQSETGKQISLAEKLYSIEVPYHVGPSVLWSNSSDFKACTIDGIPVETPHAQLYTDVDRRAERWTRALRFLLSNLKWLLVWIVQRQKNKLNE